MEFDEETQSCKVKRIKTGDNAEKALSEVYEKLSPQNKQYFGKYETFEYWVLNFDSFMTYERKNYILFVNPIVNREY